MPLSCNVSYIQDGCGHPSYTVSPDRRHPRSDRERPHTLATPKAHPPAQHRQPVSNSAGSGPQYQTGRASSTVPKPAVPALPRQPPPRGSRRPTQRRRVGAACDATPRAATVHPRKAATGTRDGRHPHPPARLWRRAPSGHTGARRSPRSRPRRGRRPSRRSGHHQRHAPSPPPPTHPPLASPSGPHRHAPHGGGAASARRGGSARRNAHSPPPGRGGRGGRPPVQSDTGRRGWPAFPPARALPRRAAPRRVAVATTMARGGGRAVDPPQRSPARTGGARRSAGTVRGRYTIHAAAVVGKPRERPRRRAMDEQRLGGSVGSGRRAAAHAVRYRAADPPRAGAPARWLGQPTPRAALYGMGDWICALYARGDHASAADWARAPAPARADPAKRHPPTPPPRSRGWRGTAAARAAPPRGRRRRPAVRRCRRQPIHHTFPPRGCPSPPPPRVSNGGEKPGLTDGVTPRAACSGTPPARRSPCTLFSQVILAHGCRGSGGEGGGVGGGGCVENHPAPRP